MKMEQSGPKRRRKKSDLGESGLLNDLWRWNRVVRNVDEKQFRPRGIRSFKRHMKMEQSGPKRRRKNSDLGESGLLNDLWRWNKVVRNVDAKKFRPRGIRSFKRPMKMEQGGPKHRRKTIQTSGNQVFETTYEYGTGWSETSTQKFRPRGIRSFKRPMKMEQSDPKRRCKKFRPRGIRSFKRPMKMEQGGPKCRRKTIQTSGNQVF